MPPNKGKRPCASLWTGTRPLVGSSLIRATLKPIVQILWVLGTDEVVGGVRISKIEPVHELIYGSGFRLSLNSCPPCST